MTDVNTIIIQKLGGDYPSPISDMDIQFAMEEVQQEIINYCNILFVPAQLNFTWANMVVDYVRWQAIARSPVDEDAETEIAFNLVKSLKLGNMDIDLSGGSSSAGTAGSSTNPLKAHAPNLDTVLMNYKAQLNRFVNPLNGGM